MHLSLYGVFPMFVMKKLLINLFYLLKKMYPSDQKVSEKKNDGWGTNIEETEQS